MSRSRWIFVVLIGVFAIALIYSMNSPELSQRYLEARREAALSADTKEIIMVALAAVIAGYLGWYFLIRRD